MNGIYATLRSVKLDDDFLEATRSLVTRLGVTVDWIEFGKFPGGPEKKSSRRKTACVRRILGGRSRYRFMDTCTDRSADLLSISRSRGANSEVVFRLLCRSELVDEQDLDGILPVADINGLIARGVLVRCGQSLASAVRFVPYGKSFYLTDSLLLGHNRPVDGMQPVYLGFETHRQIQILRDLLHKGSVPRMLEVGCGTGIVTLELADLATDLHGVDNHNRSLLFAEVNQRLHSKNNARFYYSDLLYQVDGIFDLIVFNPFRPTHENLSFFQSFVEQSLGKLSSGGRILLVLHAETSGLDDSVYDAIAALLADRHCSVVRTFIQSGGISTSEVASVSILNITNSRKGKTSAWTTWNGEWFKWSARRIVAACRG
jgi:hypothetical protein